MKARSRDSIGIHCTRLLPCYCITPAGGLIQSKTRQDPRAQNSTCANLVGSTMSVDFSACCDPSSFPPILQQVSIPGTDMTVLSEMTARLEIRSENNNKLSQLSLLTIIHHLSHSRSDQTTSPSTVPSWIRTGLR